MVVGQIMVKPEEAAKLLGISRSTAYELLKRKSIPSRRVGSRIRIPLDALRAWAQQQDSDSTPAR
jgi:excisionase family DNA binding protein